MGKLHFEAQRKDVSWAYVLVLEIWDGPYYGYGSGKITVRFQVSKDYVKGGWGDARWEISGNSLYHLDKASRVVRRVAGKVDKRRANYIEIDRMLRILEKGVQVVKDPRLNDKRVPIDEVADADLLLWYDDPEGTTSGFSYAEVLAQDEEEAKNLVTKKLADLKKYDHLAEWLKLGAQVAQASYTKAPDVTPLSELVVLPEPEPEEEEEVEEEAMDDESEMLLYEAETEAIIAKAEAEEEAEEEVVTLEEMVEDDVVAE